MKAFELESVPVFHKKVEVFGTCNDRFGAVRDAFKYNLDTGQDIGASLGVSVDGELVVDLWGGHFDATYTRLFGRDTIVQGYSSTKTVTALCLLYLADRGGVDLDAPVARYWPEFAAAGKSGIEVRRLISHSSGLCGWAEPMTFHDLYDWEKSTSLLARQAPLHEVGRTSAYHGYTMGHLAGEVIRRVTGRTMGRFLQDELVGPLGVAGDYYIGTPEECDPRVSSLIQGAPQDHATGQRYHDIALYNPHPTPQDTAALDWRRAELGGMNGHGNGRGLATLQSVLANGGLAGRKLMTDAGRTRLLEQQTEGPDLVLGVPCRWGMGFSLETSLFEGAPQNGRSAWWAGNGGSMSFIDLEKRMAIGYVPNRWISGPHETDRARSIIRAAYQSLGPA